jgi:hypothetical protein
MSLTRVNPLAVKASEKIGKLNTQIRLLWPKYDPDLDTFINGVPLIEKMLEHCFKDAHLTKDWEHILKTKDIKKEIKAHVIACHKNNKAPSPTR